MARRGARELAETFVAISAERLEMVYDDLRALGSGPTVVVGGPRRAENAVVVRQLLAWWQDMGTADARRPGLPFSCECESPGCEQVAAVAVADYQHRSASGPVTVPGPRAARRRP